MAKSKSIYPGAGRRARELNKKAVKSHQARRSASPDTWSAPPLPPPSPPPRPVSPVKPELGSYTEFPSLAPKNVAHSLSKTKPPPRAFVSFFIPYTTASKATQTKIGRFGTVDEPEDSVNHLSQASGPAMLSFNKGDEQCACLSEQAHAEAYTTLDQPVGNWSDSVMSYLTKPPAGSVPLDQIGEAIKRSPEDVFACIRVIQENVRNLAALKGETPDYINEMHAEHQETVNSLSHSLTDYRSRQSRALARSPSSIDDLIGSGSTPKTVTKKLDPGAKWFTYTPPTTTPETSPLFTKTPSPRKSIVGFEWEHSPAVSKITYSPADSSEDLTTFTPKQISPQEKRSARRGLVTLKKTIGKDIDSDEGVFETLPQFDAAMLPPSFTPSHGRRGSIPFERGSLNNPGLFAPPFVLGIAPKDFKPGPSNEEDHASYQIPKKVHHARGRSSPIKRQVYQSNNDKTPTQADFYHIPVAIPHAFAPRTLYHGPHHVVRPQDQAVHPFGFSTISNPAASYPPSTQMPASSFVSHYQANQVPRGFPNTLNTAHGCGHDFSNARDHRSSNTSSSSDATLRGHARGVATMSVGNRFRRQSTMSDGNRPLHYSPSLAGDLSARASMSEPSPKMLPGDHRSQAISKVHRSTPSVDEPALIQQVLSRISPDFKDICPTSLVDLKGCYAKDCVLQRVCTQFNADWLPQQGEGPLIACQSGDNCTWRHIKMTCSRALEGGVCPSPATKSPSEMVSASETPQPQLRMHEGVHPADVSVQEWEDRVNLNLLVQLHQRAKYGCAEGVSDSAAPKIQPGSGDAGSMSQWEPTSAFREHQDRQLIDVPDGSLLHSNETHVVADQAEKKQANRGANKGSLPREDHDDSGDGGSLSQRENTPVVYEEKDQSFQDSDGSRPQLNETQASADEAEKRQPDPGTGASLSPRGVAKPGSAEEEQSLC